ncbi:uncharacterized protein LOC131879303 [Tigriopus californicus]|uniref:uncharacterized protein LOC131879303 n=1 Tax=Tigriopus californicus TaxID=6832 RepID=UPI0027DA77AB|nr:uncharacterized protein LOC131879303 [Tigriopus californicus]
MAFDCYASPLQPIISTLEILKLFGGFPLKILDQDGTTFHFQPIRGIALSVMLPMSLIILINIILKDLRQTLVVLPDRNSKMEIAKLSGTELITGFLQFLPNVCGLVIVIILFLKGHKGLSHLCHAIKGFNSDGKIAGDYSRLGSRNVTIILGFYILILFSGFGLIVYFYLIMGSNPIPWDTFVILALLIVLQFFLVFFPVAMASSYLICQQILGSFKVGYL